MDLATVVGLVLAFGIMIVAIMLGGPLGLFINVPSLLIVIVGTIGAVMMKFTLAQFIGSISVAMKTILFKADKPEDLITQGVELANIARKEGMMALEQQQIDNTFLAKGIQLCVDGHAPELVRKMLDKDLEQSIKRHESGIDVLKATGDLAPAMGMIGTLIGLVQMLANMEDPKTIGPAMAIALLTTLYGAMIANIIAIPMAGKLEVRNAEEEMNRTLIIETISAIQEGINPRVLEEILKTFLAEKKRDAIGG